MLRGHKNLGPLSSRSIRLVVSADLSPAGSLLATGSLDHQVRICKSRYSPEFALALICRLFFCFREIHYRFLTAVDSAHTNLSGLLSFPFHS